MLNKSELLNNYSDSFQMIETHDYNASNIFFLNFETIDEFMELAKDVQAKQIYFTYRYYSDDLFLLSTEEYEDYSDNIKSEVKQHNETVESLDFFKPAQLDLFILINGTMMKVSIFDLWIDDMEILRKDDKMEELEEQFENEFERKEEEEAKKRKEDEARLREYILSDPEFSYKKNMRLRQDYLLELFSKDEFKKYNYLFNGTHNRGISLPTKNFMDRVWQEYREIKKNS